MLIASFVALALLMPPSAIDASELNGHSVQASGISGRAWSTARLSTSPRLVIVLHGDLAGPNDEYQYKFARLAAQHLEDTVVIAALRPGYEDSGGLRSKGDHGLATGDNYTPEVITRIRAFIDSERAARHARSVTLVGHSGGAAIAADLLEEDTTISSRMLLVSCPCDLGAWRRHMFLSQFNPAWLLPVRSLSPLERARRLPHDLRLRIVVGEGDRITPPRLSAAFASVAIAAGLHPALLALPGIGHNALLDPRVLRQLAVLQNAP